MTHFVRLNYGGYLDLQVPYFTSQGTTEQVDILS